MQLLVEARQVAIALLEALDVLFYLLLLILCHLALVKFPQFLTREDRELRALVLPRGSARIGRGAAQGMRSVKSGVKHGQIGQWRLVLLHGLSFIGPYATTLILLLGGAISHFL